MSDSRNQRWNKVSIATVVALVLTTAVSTAVIAAHSFTDVPDTNTFHSDIAWLKNNDVTRGCNPPANDEFCPSDNVTREQMSAFMRRLARTSSSAGDQVAAEGDAITIDSDTPIEVASIHVAPKAQARVVLNAHVVVAIAADESSRGDFDIRRGSCESDDIVTAAHWSLSADEDLDLVVGDTFSLTGFDVVDGPLTYVLCVANQAPDSPEAAAAQRALTATWTPTA